MARFHPLRVTHLYRTIPDAVVLTLAPEDPAAFRFTQGQYLTFRRQIDGVELRRNYSICTAPDDGVIQVAIKRVEGGAFSTWANTELKVGDVLEAMPPQGRFFVPLAPQEARHYLGFAGGSGITPILSHIRTVMKAEPASSFTLVYANRALNTVMFREELEDLKNLHMGRLSVVHVLEHDTNEIELFTGRLTEEKCAALFRSWVDVEAADYAFICGPEPMMDTVSAALRAHGMDSERIRMELFTAAQPGRARAPRPRPAGEAAEGAEVSITLDGVARRIRAAPGQTVLEAARAAGLPVPYSCQAGVCSTCMCRVTEGRVEMLRNHALEDYEVERGYVLSCQSVPQTGKVAVVYEDH